MKKELRAGNIVKVTYQGDNFEIKTGTTIVLDLSGKNGWEIEVEALEESFENVQVSPARLNEEILLGFGAVRNPWGVTIGELLFKCNTDCSRLILQVGHGHEIEVDYVHELQNLYQALTKKELDLFEAGQKWQKVDGNTKLIKYDWYWLKGRFAPFQWLCTHFGDGFVEVGDVLSREIEFIHIPNPNKK